MKRILWLMVGVFALASCSRKDHKTDVTSKEFDSKAYAAKVMEDARNDSVPNIRVEDARLSPTTPLEAFQGYDTAVDLTFALDGAAPSWWGTINSDEQTSRGEVFSADGRKITVAVRCTTPKIARNSNSASRTPLPPEERRYQSRYVLRLKGKRGPLTLRDELPFFFGRKPIPNAVVKVEVPILKQGEVGREAKPDKTPGARIESLKLEKTSPQSAQLALKYLRIVSGRSGIKTEIVDERGKIWPIKPKFSWDFDELSGADGFEMRRMDFDLSSIPSTAGALVLRGYAYDGDAWPASFSVRLRDKAGKILSASRDWSRPKSRLSWKIISSRAFSSQPNTDNFRRRMEIIVEALPGEIKASERGWNFGQDAILVAKGYKKSLRFEQMGFERYTPRAMLWMDVDLPKDKIQFPARLEVKIKADEGPQVPVSVLLKQ